MTALRPEHEGEIGASYKPQGTYEGRDDDDDAFEAVVGGLADPLTDPIPATARAVRREDGEAPPPPAPTRAGDRAADTARAQNRDADRPREARSTASGERTGDAGTGRRARTGPPASAIPPSGAQDHAGMPDLGLAPVPGPEATAYLRRTPPAPAPRPGPDADATAFLPKTPPAPASTAPAFSDAEQTLISLPLGASGGTARNRPPAPAGPVRQPPQAQQEPRQPKQHPRQQARQQPQPQAPPVPDVPTAAVPTGVGAVDQETVALRTADVRRAVDGDTEAATPAGGRAERRKAAKAGTRGRKKAPTAPAAAQQRPPGRPLTRIEARQAARALKDSPGVVVSRAVGELFITFGVLMLLFVTYQLWWTNVRADNFANNEASKIQSTWKSNKGPAAGAFEPGQGFAIIHIPKLDVVAPIAQGVSKEKVLDHGEVGHYSEGGLKTAMPEDKTGNFALAGHRNTHGEPFRYINQLVPGDKVVVETQDEYYTYEMTRTLPQTSPSNVGVISPIPQGSGFTTPGRYITLTTCTPEFRNTYRLIVWGKMVSEQPRSQGLPAALQHH